VGAELAVEPSVEVPVKETTGEQASQLPPAPEEIAKAAQVDRSVPTPSRRDQQLGSSASGRLAASSPPRP
jgi:hypothetical protein